MFSRVPTDFNPDSTYINYPVIPQIFLFEKRMCFFPVPASSAGKKAECGCEKAALSGEYGIPGEAAPEKGRENQKRYSGCASVLGIQTGVFWKVLA